MEKKQEVTFEMVTYSSLSIINEEELLGEWQVFKRTAFQEKKVMMGKIPWKQVMLVYFQKLLKR